MPLRELGVQTGMTCGASRSGDSAVLRNVVAEQPSLYQQIAPSVANGSSTLAHLHKSAGGRRSRCLPIEE